MSSEPASSSSVEISETERAIFGPLSAAELHAFLDAYARRHLSSGIARVRFRAGRIDAVWGVELADGRAVVIKTHRPPVDLEATRAAGGAQRHLSAAGFPAPVPLSGPDEVDGRVLTAEALLVGEPPDGRNPAHRRLLAGGLARHIAILRDQPDLSQRAGPGPSWCQYGAGPWPVPHDSMVDFTSTTSGYEWLDELGRRAADQILAHRDAAELVVGHADWYGGNTVVADGRLAGTFDWELTADPEAVIAGFAAACYAASSTSGGGLSTPDEVAAFLRDYDAVRDTPLSEPERRMAAGAAAWIVAFNARWQVALLAQDRSNDPELVTLVQQHQADYLNPGW